MNNVFTLKNLQLALIAGIFAFVMVYFIAPQFMQGASVAEACCGSGGGGGGDSDPSPSYPGICHYLKANGQIGTVNLPYGGGDVKFAWETTYAHKVTLNGETVSLDGSKTINVTSAGTFTLLAIGSDGTGSCKVTIKVAPEGPAPTCDSFVALPTSVIAGSNVTLSWMTSNATDVSIDRNVGSVSADGSKTVKAPTTPGSYTYTLTATGNGKSVTCPATIEVTKAPEPKVCDIKASLDSVAFGGSVTLTWNTTGYSDVKINGESVALDGSKTYTNIQNNTTFKLTATSASGDDTCTATVIVKCLPPPVLPTCDSFKAQPGNIQKGQSSTLSWMTTNATNVSIDNNIGSVDPDGSKVVSPTQTTLYTLTATNVHGDKVKCTAKVVVTDVPVPTCDSFTAQPATIEKGQSVTLSWATTNATNVSIDNNIGSVDPDGSKVVNPTQSTTYTLTATGNGGTVTCPVTITVEDPVDTAPVCNSFTANPTSLPVGGGDTTLTWRTTNATKVMIDQNIGEVAVDGSRLVSITKTTNFVLTATDDDGDKVTCPVRVLVDTPTPDPITCEDNVSFNANPRSIDEGDDSTLSWSTNGITSVRFEGISNTSLNGTEVVSPRSDTTYVLIASDGTDTVRCPIKIEVDEDNGGGGGSSTPRCDLDISDSKISAGERVTITWDTSRATRVVLKDNHGKTLVTTDGVLGKDKEDLYDGEITVRPEEDTTYTLIAERGSRDRECKVEVEVDDKIVVLETRNQQPLVTGIALTQVPYTGFEAGPMLTVLFYTLLVLWALYLAYVLVIRKNSPTLAMAGVDQTSYSETIVSDDEDENPAMFTASVQTPTFHMPIPVAPVKESVQVGYDSVVATNDEATQIENHAHAAQVLLSSDAMRYFMATTEGEDRIAALDRVINEAKASYPTEDGWVVLNEERVIKTCDTCFAAAATPSNDAPYIPATMPIGNSSLAEAIVTGNIVAAYQMIGNRPMIALADAAADLDALYRVKQGVEAPVSELLARVGASIEAETLHTAISALTSALDGTYTNEGEAVKMAIMKATKAING